MDETPVLYELRQNKFVSRRLFVEILRRVERYRSLDEYAYLGLGGPTLEDHRLLHAHFGIMNLVSIEMNPLTHKRQEFNKPIACIRCIQSTTKEVIDDFHSVRELIKVSGDDPIIFWLDYEEPKAIGQQLDELRALLAYCGHGDVIRITINAHPSSLDVGAKKETLAEKLWSKRLDVLQDRLGSYFPSDTAPEDMKKAKLPNVLFRAIRIAVQEALPPRLGREFLPILMESYSDNHQMISVTGIILSTGEREEFLRVTGLGGWEFYANDWANGIDINVPPLSVRERFALDNFPATATKDVLARDLPFPLGQDPDKDTELLFQQYKRFYRFYPEFHHVVI